MYTFYIQKHVLNTISCIFEYSLHSIHNRTVKFFRNAWISYESVRISYKPESFTEYKLPPIITPLRVTFLHQKTICFPEESSLRRDTDRRNLRTFARLHASCWLLSAFFYYLLSTPGIIPHLTSGSRTNDISAIALSSLRSNQHVFYSHLLFFLPVSRISYKR